MTVSSTTSKVSYTGNGLTTTFAVPFYFLAAADLEVILRSGTTETVQALTTNYTVSGAGNEAGGTVTMLVAPAAATTLTIRRSIAVTQGTDLLPNDRLPAEDLEDGLDKLTMIAQQLGEESGRSLKYPASDAAVSAQLPAASARASKFLTFDSNGLPVATVGVDATTDIFTQAGTGAVSRSVNDKLRDMVSLKDFGAVGDGVSNDTAAVQAALSSQRPLNWGGLSYRITSPVSVTLSDDLCWDGNGARIVYAGSHVQSAISVVTAGFVCAVNGITVDGGKLANQCLSIENNSDSYSDIYFSDVHVTRAKRSSSFNGGAAVYVRGSFGQMTWRGGSVSDCELPSGQGTPGVIGISGVSIDSFSATRYAKNVLFDGVRVEKVYSSDLAYSGDQDGILYFAPTVGSQKAQSLLTAIGCSFINCYGRSIKTQVRETSVISCGFSRTEGLSSGVGNGEIDSQTGDLSVRDSVFNYANGQEPSVCANVSGSIGRNKLVVDGCTVICDASTTLSQFASTFPADGILGQHSIQNNKIVGKTKALLTFRCNGNRNQAIVSNNWIDELVNGVTSEKALVYVEASGSSTPYSANVIAFGNTYANTGTPSLLRDDISGSSMTASLSAWNNYGFSSGSTQNPSASGLRGNPVAVMPRIGPGQAGGYIQQECVTISAGATQVISLLNNSRPTLVFVTSQINNTAYAFFMSSDTANTSISKGAAVELGNTTEPVSGTLRIWTSGTNQLSIKNTDASARTVYLIAFVAP